MNNITNDFDELILLIKDSDIYKEYKELENKISKNKDIKTLINKIKRLQKQAVKAEYTKDLSLESIEREISNTYVELNSIPLYNEYEDKMNELNNLLLVIKNKFDSFIKELIL